MTPQVQYHTIAGQNGGKRVSCKPELVPAFQNLQRASRSGNYWATIAVREIESLSTGLEGKSNVYFRPGAKEATSGTQIFTVFLPGLRATLFKWPDGNIRIDELHLDGMYEATSQIKETTRMGLYRVDRSAGSGRDLWEATYEESGKILSRIGRVVAIADAGYSNANHAANRAVPTMTSTLRAREASIRNNGCDLHFTPGGGRIGGLLAYNPLNINASRASAAHLAESMVQAQSIEEITWVAERGDSAVLTQAMQILVDRGLTLRGHTVYFYKPSTSVRAALQLAHKLELSLNKSFADTGFSLHGVVSQWSAAGLRLRNTNDPYDKAYHAHSWLSGMMKAGSVMGLAGAGAASLGASIVMVGTIASVIGTTGTAIALYQSVAADVRHRLKQ